MGVLTGKIKYDSDYMSFCPPEDWRSPISSGQDQCVMINSRPAKQAVGLLYQMWLNNFHVMIQMNILTAQLYKVVQTMC